MTRFASALALLTATAALAAAPLPAVAVLYFDVTHPDPNVKVFNKAFAQLLITDLATVTTLKTVERERLEEVMAELKLQAGKAFDSGTAQKVGQLLGAKYQVTGEIIAVGKDVLFQARVIEVATGKLLRTAAPLRVKATAEEILEAEQKLFEQVSQAIAGAEASARSAPTPTRKSGKLKLNTAVKYAEALDAIDKKDKVTAKTKLQEVLKEQPDFVLASLDLDKLVK
jgi:TolB-like protein